MSNNEGLVKFEDMQLCNQDNIVLNADQLNFIFKKTPKKHVYKRVAKGGGQWEYVTGVYVKKVLNLVFGFNWSFEVVEHKIDLDVAQAYVLGRLTVNSNGKQIVKMQFGRVDIKFRKQPNENGIRLPLDVGNDLKAATTDALKKCAAELGIASDVYAPNEFKEIQVVETENVTVESLKEYYDQNDFDISEEDKMNIERIIQTKEKNSYENAMMLLKRTEK